MTARSGVDADLQFHQTGLPVDQSVDEKELTIAQSVRYAIERDPGLQSALARVKLAAADADQSRRLPNPVLDFILRWGPGKPQFEISLAQNFVQILEMPRRTSAADNRLRRAAADALTVGLDVIADAQTTYAEARAAAIVLPVLESRLTIAKRLVSLADARVQAGEATREDVSVAKARVADLTVEFERARLAQERAQLRLAKLIGAPSSETNWALTSPAEQPAAAPETDWIRTALANQPNLQAARWQLAALQDEAALAAWSIWEQSTAGADAQRDDQWFVGPSVSLPIPIFDDGTAATARSQAAVIEARHELTRNTRAAIQDVRDAWRSYASLTQSLAAAQNQLLPAQRSRRQLAEAAYRSGQVDITAVDLAEHDLRTAELQVIELERDRAISLVRLERAAGGPAIAAPLLRSGDQAQPTPQSHIHPQPVPLSQQHPTESKP